MRLDLEVHNHMVLTDNKVLGHFSNRELAVFTAAQRKPLAKAVAVNGEKLVRDELDRVLRQYGDLREIEDKQEKEGEKI